MKTNVFVVFAIDKKGILLLVSKVLLALRMQIEFGLRLTRNIHKIHKHTHTHTYKQTKTHMLTIISIPYTYPWLDYIKHKQKVFGTKLQNPLIYGFVYFY